MLIENIENFRKSHLLSIDKFCEKVHIQERQYRRYLKGNQNNLSVRDALMLSASFSEEININKLLELAEEQNLFLRPGFPSFGFSKDPKLDYENSERIFRQYFLDAVYKLFQPTYAIKLHAAMVSLCDKTKVWLPLSENMYSLMYTLRDIRKIRFNDFDIPYQTVLSHFQRKRLVTRFADLCNYERAFDSGGIYLLSELMYQNEKRHLGIALFETIGH